MRVEETFKGELPTVVHLHNRGGSVEDGGEACESSPNFSTGEERLLYLGRRTDGSVYVRHGEAGAPRLRRRDGSAEPANARLLPLLRRARTTGPMAAGSDQPNTATSDDTTVLTANSTTTSSTAGLTVDANGIPVRFIEPDAGRTIPYLVDADALPASITQEQALQAVRNALAAWSAVSSVQFRFEGVQSFGQSAANVGVYDGRLRIQLHDLYGAVGSDGVLGIGGVAWTNGGTPFSTTGGTGARVVAQEFHRIRRSYVVLAHTQPWMQVLSTFEEVLCHEIGHSLGLDHSSNLSTETDAAKRDAIMYYLVHADGRGARLGTYDIAVIPLVHPANTPPWLPERTMTVLTGPAAPSFAGANTITLAGYDLQTAAAALTWTSTGATANGGTFALGTTTLGYTPSAYWADTSVDPAGGSYYDIIYLRASDGVNASAWTQVRVVGFAPDTYPTGGDGLPDAWMVANFGNADPGAGTGRGPADDPDGDGLTNLQEYQLGTNPLSANSRFAITSFSLAQLQWAAKPGELYVVEKSDDLVTWTPLIPTVTLATSTTGTAANFIDTTKPRQFYRVRRTP